jgi:hypothetical protein
MLFVITDLACTLSAEDSTPGTSVAGVVMDPTDAAGYVGVQTSPFFMQPVSALPVRRLQAAFRIRY